MHVRVATYWAEGWDWMRGGERSPSRIDMQRKNVTTYDSRYEIMNLICASSIGNSYRLYMNWIPLVNLITEIIRICEYD